MNFSFNIFGRNGSKDLYYKSDDRKLLGKIAGESRDKSQITVYRNDSTINYVYIKRLSGRRNFLGICLKFNGYYCTDNKRFFDLFEEITLNEIVKNKRILESDLNGQITFTIDNFSRNEVDIENLDKLFQNKIESDFKYDFEVTDNSFNQGNIQKQSVSFYDEPEYIIKNIKKYNYVTITPDKVSYVKKNRKWILFMLPPFAISILIFFSLYFISGWHLTNFFLCLFLLAFGLCLYYKILKSDKTT